MELIKGYGKFVEKIPLFAGKGIVWLFLYLFAIIATVSSELILFYSLPDILLRAGVNGLFLAFIPPIGVLTVELIGFTFVFQLWRLRDRLKARLGPRSYRRVFPLGLLGISHVMLVAFHQFVPYYRFSPTFWQSSPLSILATPLDSFITGPLTGWLSPLITVISIILLLTGILMALRALLTFGFDYMTVVYLYFPEESTIQNHKIYSILRHPAYTSILLVNLAGMLFTLTPISIILFFFYLLGFWCHVHFVEERELIARFGDSYAQYRKSVPPFFVKPEDFGKLLAFLVGRR